MNSKTDPNNKLINVENGIIKMQRRYKTLKSEINALNYSVTFQKDYLMSMINNLSHMNTLKLYQDTDSLFMSILNESKSVFDQSFS